jgi:hypothetical protein
VFLAVGEKEGDFVFGGRLGWLAKISMIFLRGGRAVLVAYRS